MHIGAQPSCLTQRGVSWKVVALVAKIVSLKLNCVVVEQFINILNYEPKEADFYSSFNMEQKFLTNSTFVYSLLIYLIHAYL